MNFEWVCKEREKENTNKASEGFEKKLLSLNNFTTHMTIL
jgi:hypothetical protein